MGRHDEAILAIRRAAQLDPLSARIAVNVGYRYYFARRFDEALAALQRTVPLADASNQANQYNALAYTYADMGRVDEAIATYREFAESDRRTEFDSLIPLAYAYARAGLRDQALAILDAPDADREGFVERAWVYGVLGEEDRGMTLLEQAYEAREPTLMWIKVGPRSDGLRSHPRFQELLERMNFPE